MTDIKWVPTTLAHIDVVARTMREPDVVEIAASHGRTPREALLLGLSESETCVTFVCDDEPVLIFGLVIKDLLSGRGVPWMLASNNIKRHWRAVLRHSPVVVDEMSQRCEYLSNHVHADNETNIRWLKWLGFQFDDAEPVGRNGELFHHFYYVRQGNV